MARLDQALVNLGHAPTRSQAQHLIKSGQVEINGHVHLKPGFTVPPDAKICVATELRYVSRGGLKLEAALKHFAFSVSNLCCLDVGASTGGFTDCLLQSGAKKIHALDVGHSQLSEKLLHDARVVVWEHQNFRYFDIQQIKDDIDLCVIDASFISLKLLIPQAIAILSRHNSRHEPPPTLICLIKPQFEVGPSGLGKGGIVRDQNLQLEVTSDIADFVNHLGWNVFPVMESPVIGGDGNREFLLFAQMKMAALSDPSLPAAITDIDL